MKKFKSLVTGFVCTIFTVTSFGQTVLLRAPETSLSVYQAELRSNLNLTTPTEILERRLTRADLGPQLRIQIEQNLNQVSEGKSSKFEQYQKIFRTLEAEPRSPAMRQSLLLVAEVLIQESQDPTQKSYFEKVHRGLKAADTASTIQIESPFKALAIKQEISSLKNRTGGEDLAIFWNGTPWREAYAELSDVPAQWIFVSSQLRPRILNGTWSEIQVALAEGFQNWVSGSCENFQVSDFGFSDGIDQQVVFEKKCERQAPRGSSEIAKVQVQENSRRWNPWLVAAGAMALTFLAVSLSGKKIQIKR